MLKERTADDHVFAGIGRVNINRDTFSQRVVGSTHLPSRLNMVKCRANLTSAYF